MGYVVLFFWGGRLKFFWGRIKLFLEGFRFIVRLKYFMCGEDCQFPSEGGGRGEVKLFLSWFKLFL